MSTTQTPLGLLETFKERHSSKAYKGNNLTQEQIDLINQSITEANSLQTPFNSQGVAVSSTEPGLARFGSIDSEAGWIVLKLRKNGGETKEDVERKRTIDASFIAQHVLMKLASYHINTSWVGGTFDQGAAEKRFQGFTIPAVISYGIENADPSFLRKVFSKIGSRTSRMPFEQLFYDSDNKRLISENDFNDSNKGKVPNYPPYLKDFLAAIRSGPSALNIQPWRFVVSEKEVHLFDAKMSSYSQFDIGIALANLHLLKDIRGGSCTFEVKDPAPSASPLSGTYIATAVYQE